MAKFKVAINGTGRIGLCVARILGERSDEFELVAMNSTTELATLCHLLKYDSVHGRYDAEIAGDSSLNIGAQKNVKILSSRDISALDFGEAVAVIECTGAFNSLEKASAHVKGNVKLVAISAPADNAPTFVYGVNHAAYKGESVISNASCTTNCLAPVVKVLNDAFGVESALMTTIHSYTNDQNVLDVKHKDVRRARAAALNMIPTSTGAAKAIGLVIPELAGKLNGFAVRVPTPNVSLVDLSAVLKKVASKEEINAAFEAAANGAFKGLIGIDYDKCVSSDFVGSRFSSIYVPDKCVAITSGGINTAKVLAWYDNEMGYSHRLVDMTKYALERR